MKCEQKKIFVNLQGRIWTIENKCEPCGASENEFKSLTKSLGIIED